MRHYRVVGTVLGLAMASAVALASPGEDEHTEYYGQRGPLPYEAMDLDGDGAISAEEHARIRQERHAARAKAGYPMRHAGEAPAFEEIDRDGDGAISRDELAAARVRQMQQRAHRFERDR